MRRTVAIETGLAIVLAFLLAPFQHVHTDSDHPDHAHAGEIHSHLFTTHSHPATHHVAEPGVVTIEDDDDDDHADARSIDTFSPVIPASLHLFIPARMPGLSAPRIPRLVHIEMVEARANSPPIFDRSKPRAPPL
jgi:hypothetical protein